MLTLQPQLKQTTKNFCLFHSNPYSTSMIYPAIPAQPYITVFFTFLFYIYNLHMAAINKFQLQAPHLPAALPVGSK